MRPHLRRAGQEMPGAQLQLGEPAADVPQAQPAAHQLGRHRGQRRPLHPHGKPGDEQNVQHDVHHAGRHQKIKRGAAVAQGPQGVAQQVEQQRGEHAPEDDGDIRLRLRQNICRGTQQLQQRAAQRHRCRGDQQGGQPGEQNGTPVAAAHALGVPCAGALGQHHRKAAGQPLSKAQNQKAQAAGAAHRRQCLGSQRPPHDQGIRHVVKLLKQVARKQRQRKQKDQPCRVAPRHILAHSSSLLRLFTGRTIWIFFPFFCPLRPPLFGGWGVHSPTLYAP